MKQIYNLQSIVPYSGIKALFFASVLVLAYAIIASFSVQSSQAAIPFMVNFQGKLTNVSNGTNVPNGQYTFEFKLYDDPSGGSLLWTETYDQGSGPCEELTVTNGVFNAKLGSCASLASVDFSGGDLYLTVNFDDGGGYDGEMLPRKQLLASAFAFVANSVSGTGAINTEHQSATALTVGQTGANPALQVDTNTASSATGLKVTSAAAGSGLALAVISSGTNENLTLDAKGSGTISINGSATGDILLGGGVGSTGCTLTNSNGNFACTGNIAATGTISGSNFSGTLTGTNTGDQTTSGTANRITVTNGSTNPVIDIASTYVGQTSITTLGTISTGTWQGTAIGTQYGGTGATTLTLNGVLYGNGTSAIQATAQGGANTVLVANGGSPSFSSAITVGTSVTSPSIVGSTSVTTPLLTSSSSLGITSTSGIIMMGDYTQVNNGTFINLDDQMQVIELQATELIGLGDLTGAGNANRILIQDSINMIELRSAQSTGTGITMDLPAITSGIGLDVDLGALTTGTGANFSSSTLTSGQLVNIAVTGTGAASNTQKALNVTTAGANATSTQTTYGGYFSNTHTGTNSTNVALYATASGGANNYAAIFENGNVGIGTTAPAHPLQIGATGAFGTMVFSPDYNGSSQGFMGIYDNNNSLYYGIATELPAVAGTVALGGYYKGLGVGGASDNNGDPIFGVLNSGQSANGIGNVALTVFDNNRIETFHGVLNTSAGRMGILTSTPDRQLEVNSANGNNLRLTYNDNNGSAINYADFLMSSGGDLTITPSGGDTSITGNLIVSSLAGGGTQCVNVNNSGLLGTTACGGALTPWTSDIDADGYDLQDLSNLEFRNTTGAPAGSVVAVFSDNTGDLNANVLTGKTFNVQVNGTDEYNFSSTALVINGNNITGVGTNIAGAGALTLSSTSGDLALTTTTSGNISISVADPAVGSINLNSETISVGTITSVANVVVFGPTDSVFVGDSFAAGNSTMIQVTDPTQTIGLQSNVVGITSGVTTGTGTSAGLSFVANSLTTGVGANFASSSLSSGSLLNLAVTGTAAASNTQKALNVTTSGANATSTQTTYGGYFSNTHTGTASTNVALYTSATGGTNNYAAIFENGNVGIGTTAPEEKLEVVGNIISKGTEWTSRTSAVDNDWSSVTYGNGLFVAVASSGTGNRVMTSPDGINWTARTTPVDNNWRSVTYGNGLFVAVASSGTGNRVMTSPDGINWTARTTPVDNNWQSVTYGNGLFVAVSSNGTNRVMTSPDGINWTDSPAAFNSLYFSVTYGNGTFVAVSYAGSGNRVMTSPDGINWTDHVPAASNDWNGVTYGNGTFVAISYYTLTNRVMTSTDGENWTLRTEAAGNAWRGLTYGNGLFVAVASSGTGNRVMTSPDGINWTARTTSVDNEWRSVAYGNGTFVAVANSGTGNRVMTSGKSDYIAVQHNNIYQGGLTVHGTPTFTSLAGGGTQCVNVDNSGVLGVTACGGGGGAWNDLTDPTGNLTVAHAANTTAMSWNSLTTGTAWTQSSSSITSGVLHQINQSTSSFTGTGLGMNFADSSGSFTGNFANFQVNGTTRFSVGSGTVTTTGASAVAGIFQDVVMDNDGATGYQFGNRMINTITSSTAGGHIGGFIRMIDSTALSGSDHLVRGLEVQSWTGTNNNGINTAVAAFGKTFGVHAVTSAQAGGEVQPAAVFAHLDQASGQESVGNAIRAYSNTVQGADLVSLYQETSAFTGTGIKMDFGNNSGSFNGNFADFRVGGTTKFSVSSAGIVNLNLNATATTNGLCHSGGNVNTATDTNRDVVACSGAPSDIAEWYETQAGVSAGDIVSVTGQNFVYQEEDFDAFTGMATGTVSTHNISVLGKSAQAYDNLAVGIVSTSPNQVIGTSIRDAGAQNPQPVALKGRVLVKVTSENGLIQAGDYVTTSGTVAGKGMKATAPGMVIGQALQNDNGAGLVMVFVQPMYRDPGVVVDATGNIELQRGGATTTLLASTQADAAYLIKQEGSGTILQLQSDGMDRLLVANNGSVNINVTPLTDEDLVLEVKAGDDRKFSIDARGNLAVYGAIFIRDDTLAGSIITGEDGLAEITFAYHLGTGKPVVQLTSEAELPVFAQVIEFKQDSNGNYTGFVIKSFDLISAPVQAIIHYTVFGKQAGYETFGVFNAPEDEFEFLIIENGEVVGSGGSVDSGAGSGSGSEAPPEEDTGNSDSGGGAGGEVAGDTDSGSSGDSGEGS